MTLILTLTLTLTLALARIVLPPLLSTLRGRVRGLSGNRPVVAFRLADVTSHHRTPSATVGCHLRHSATI